MTTPEIADGPLPLKAVPVRHPWRWVVAAVIAVLMAMLVHSLVASRIRRGNSVEGRWQWHVVGHALVTHSILIGAWHTVLLTVTAMVVGVLLGTLLAVMRLSPNPIVAAASWLYIYFFRGTPVLLQIIFWFYLAYLYPTLSIGIPFTHVAFVHFGTTKGMTKFLAALLGLGLNEAAYMAEIVRAGIISVDEGQTEAASALGMRRILIMRRIVLPQAMRVIIPPTGNETISMLKSSALASTIAYVELLYSAQLIYSVNFETIPYLVAVAIWYLAMTSVLYVGQYYLERHFARGSTRNLPKSPLQRLRSVLSFRRNTDPEVSALLSSGRPHQ